MNPFHPSFAANDSGVSSDSAFSLHPFRTAVTPFAQAGGLGKARQLFPELPALLNELNTVLAA
jgi:hypothetical protein